jgi:hypothetical protein
VAGRRSSLIPVLAAAVAVVLGLTVTGASGASTTGPSGPTGATMTGPTGMTGPTAGEPIEQQLGAILLQGHPRATHLRAVLTTTTAAESLLAPGSGGAATMPAYLACAKGRFWSLSTPPPVPGSKPRRITPARVECVVLIAPGLFRTFLALRARYPNLRTLGPVLNLSST